MPTAETAKIPAAPTWDIETIFPGGSSSIEFNKFREAVTASIAALEQQVDSLPEQLTEQSAKSWRSFILELQTIEEKSQLLSSFSHCLVAQNVDDHLAHAHEDEANLLISRIIRLKTSLEFLASNQPDEEWDKLLKSADLQAISFYLNEMRQNARIKMPLEQESLTLELAVSGYHAWNRLYDKMAGDLRVDFQENGSSITLSLGQLATKMSDPERKIRRQAFEKMTEAWQSRAELAAIALNAQAGFRLTIYNKRKWETPLFEPLRLSRMKQESLDTMWRVIASKKDRLKPYLQAKTKSLKIDANRWYDQFAPMGASDRLFSFDEAGDFIVKNVEKFSTDMADFCRKALQKRWVEAEDRPGKAGGGYCTGMGPLRQSRIFMTYSGSYDSLLTLAHELGHAYHSHVLRDIPYWGTEYTMTTAETASIFSELLVTDAALGATDNPNEKLMLIDQKLQAAYTFFCDVRSRYLFDFAFYQQRSKGTVPVEQLNEMMVAAQKEAFGDLLDPSGYHPYFWCSKLHFFITELPFYNYPYVVGFLFAGGVYERARKEGRSFAEKYRELLKDTGSMTTEQVAEKHLDADLTKEDFWAASVDRALADVDEFVKLVSV